ncbi:MAG TPA: cupredoxin domain-containing protein, partial [Candidatus Saccharimonadales bacterium]
NMKAFIIALVAAIVIGGGGYLALHKSSSTTPMSTTSSSTSPSQDSTPTTNQSASDTITFDGSKFSPATITVKSGTTVTIKNTSANDMRLNSNPHPVHTDDVDLNVGLVSAGQSKTFVATKVGSFGFHDHLDPSIQGRITIN